MSSGIGVKGTIGRCYPFYADLKKCVVRSFGVCYLVCCEIHPELACPTRLLFIALLPQLCRFLLLVSFGFTWVTAVTDDITVSPTSRPKSTRKARRPCAGKKTRTTSNAFTDLRKSNAFWQFELSGRGEKQRAINSTLMFDGKLVHLRCNI